MFKTITHSNLADQSVRKIQTIMSRVSRVFSGYRARIHLLLEALTKKQVRLHTAIDKGVLLHEKKYTIYYASLERVYEKERNCPSSISQVNVVQLSSSCFDPRVLRPRKLFGERAKGHCFVVHNPRQK